LLDLQERLYHYRKSRIQCLTTAKGLRDFLRKFGFSTESEIDRQVEINTTKLKGAREERNQQEKGYANDTHASDKIRTEIRSLIEDIVVLEQGIVDLENRIEQQETLRSELVSSKFKLAKSSTIATVFQNVEFDNCPDCGTSIKERVVPENTRTLCGSPKGKVIPERTDETEHLQLDLNERIKELEASIDLHKKSLNITKKELQAKNALRRKLDERLEEELKKYESVFLSNIRRIDQLVATYEERSKGLKRLKLMPREINKLETDAADFQIKEQQVREQIIVEQQKIIRGEALLDELQEVFLKTLTDVGVPGVSKDDVIYINRKTFEVQVWPKGEEYLNWNFYSAGSGGKKTLFNTCFLLSLHIVASRHDLPLPSFIIVNSVDSDPVVPGDVDPTLFVGEEQ
jgi:hypothetical protein